MQVLVDNLVVQYQRFGNGQTILLVHGWGDSSETFSQISQQLSKEYEVVTLDLPGFGKSSLPSESWGLDDYAKLLKKFIDKLDINISCFVGHSNGGAILIYGLGNNILAADNLVLIASAGIRNKEKLKKMSLKTVSKSGKIVTSLLPTRTKDSIRHKFYSSIGSDLHVVPGMEGTYKKIVKQDVQVFATQIKIPTLLIYGRQDKSTPILYGKILTSKIPDSELIILDHVGHFIHHEKPNEVVKLIKDFI